MRRGRDRDTEAQTQKQVKSQRQQKKRQKRQETITQLPEVRRGQRRPRPRQAYPNKGIVPPHTIVYREKDHGRAKYYRLQPNTKVHGQFWCEDNPCNLQRRSGSEPPDPGDHLWKEAVPPAKEPHIQKTHCLKTVTYKVVSGSAANQIVRSRRKTTQQEARLLKKGPNHVPRPNKVTSPSKVGEQYIAQGARARVATGYPTDISVNALLGIPMALGTPVPSKGSSRTRYPLHKQPAPNQRNRPKGTGRDPSKSSHPSGKRLGPRAVHGNEPTTSPSKTSSPRPGPTPPPVRLGPPRPGYHPSAWPHLRPGPVRPRQGPQHLPNPLDMLRPTIYGPFFPPDHFPSFKQGFRPSDQPVRPLLSPGHLPKHSPLPPPPNSGFESPLGFEHSFPIVPHPGLHHVRTKGSSHQSQKSSSVERIPSSESIEAPPTPPTPERGFPTHIVKQGKRRRRDE